MAFVGGGFGRSYSGGGGFSNSNNARRTGSGLEEDIVCGCVKVAQMHKQTKVQLLKERIRQFSIWYYEEEEQRDTERFMLRHEREKRKKEHINDSSLKLLKWLYMFDALIWIVGFVFTLCSTVKVVGKNTVFYREKELYRIIGACTLFFGVFVLLVATGVKHKLRSRYQQPVKNFYILTKSSSSKGRLSRTDSAATDTSRTMDYAMENATESTKHILLRNNNTIQKTTNGFNCQTESHINNESTYSPRIQEPERSTQENRLLWSKTKWMRVESEELFGSSEDETDFTLQSSSKQDNGKLQSDLNISPLPDLPLCQNFNIDKTMV